MSLTLGEIFKVVEFMDDGDNYKLALVCKEYQLLSMTLDLKTKKNFFMFENEIKDSMKSDLIFEDDDFVHFSYIDYKNGYNRKDQRLKTKTFIHTITIRNYLCLSILTNKFNNITLNYNSKVFPVICNYPFKEIIIPNDVEVVPCCSGCYNIETLTIPPTVKTLGNSCFAECTNLKSVIIEAQLESIPMFCFDKCYKLDSIILPNSIKFIYQDAFKYCNFKKFIIQSNVEIIYSWILAFNDNLEEILIKKRDKFIDFGADLTGIKQVKITYENQFNFDAGMTEFDPLCIKDYCFYRRAEIVRDEDKFIIKVPMTNNILIITRVDNIDDFAKNGSFHHRDRFIINSFKDAKVICCGILDKHKEFDESTSFNFENCEKLFVENKKDFEFELNLPIFSQMPKLKTVIIGKNIKIADGLFNSSVEIVEE